MLNGKILKLIFASPFYDGRLAIGNNGGMPWQGMLPSDMRRFVRLTSYHSVIMGRKTWDSLDTFRPLPNRQNIILTGNPDFVPEFPQPLRPNTEVVVAHTIQEALRLAKSENVWIIGGGMVYVQTLPDADYLHWTQIHKKFEGDTFFPCFNWHNWKKIDEEHCAAGVSGTEKRKDQIDSSYYAFQRIR